MNASKVSPSAILHPTDVSRFCFDVATLMDESNDSILMLWRVSTWLRCAGMFQVSDFVFFHSINVSRYNLDPATSVSPSNKSNDSMQVFRGISTWLHDADAFWVSHFDFWHLTNVYSFDFDSSALLSMPNVSIWAVWMSDGWPRQHR